jgi:hypothetical protein
MRQEFSQFVQFCSEKILVSRVFLLLEAFELVLYYVGSTGNLAKFRLFQRDHKRFQRIDAKK